MLQLKDNQMLIQPNSLVNAEYDLTKHESNLVLMSLGLLNTTVINTNNNAITFDIADLYALSNTKLRKDRYISTIKKAINDLYNKSITMANPITKQIKQYRWLITKEAYYDISDHRVTLHFHPDLLTLFSEIEGNYTQCLLKNVMPLKSSYAKRLYQVAMQYKPPERKIPEISLGEFRQMLALLDSYPDYKELNRRVIMPAIKDINKQTDILLNVIPVKTGKTVNALQFTYRFKSKSQQSAVIPSAKKSFKRQAKQALKGKHKPLSKMSPAELNDHYTKQNKQILGK